MSELSLSDQELDKLQQVEIHSSQSEHDASLLTVVKSDWAFGQWQKLAAMRLQEYAAHPDRDKVALLVGAAHQQLGDIDKTRFHIKLARLWGCQQELVNKVLVSGVQNSLGRVHALAGNNGKAKEYMEGALTMLLGQSESKPIKQSRTMSELIDLGMLPQAAKILGEEVESLSHSGRPTEIRAKAAMLKSELDLIKHNLALAHQKRQLYQSHNTQGDTTESFEQRLERLSPSQLGQDLWVLEHFNYKRKGFFVEFGATDGVLLSNSFLLEKEFGWHGICAEPNPNFFKRLKLNRQCQVSDACIAGVSGETVNFVLADEFGGIQDFVDAGVHHEKVKAYEEQSQALVLETISLHDFLVKHNAPKDIDYISIDTEGSEFSILDKFPFDKWNVTCFTVEHNFEPQRDSIYQLFLAQGYKRIEKEWDDWYVKVAG